MRMPNDQRRRVMKRAAYTCLYGIDNISAAIFMALSCVRDKDLKFGMFVENLFNPTVIPPLLAGYSGAFRIIFFFAINLRLCYKLVRFLSRRRLV